MRSRAIAAMLLVLLPAVSACDSDGAEPGGKGSASTTPSPSASSSASASPTGPAPATGPVAELGHTLRYRIPEGERSHVAGSGGLIVVGNFHVEGGIYDINGSEQRSTATLEEAGPIEVQVTCSVRDHSSSCKHTGNRTVDGQEVYVIEAEGEDGRLYEIVGLRNGYLFSVEFEWPNSYAPGRDVVESVLATIEWK
ncbi:MAG TPA: hypothetical protein VNS81_00785 [Nocardioides sp.]|nr:hypothetical protein [Nocardioides sp.]